MIRRGRGLVQLPGPTDIPERVLRALARPSVEFGTAGFAELVAGCLGELARILGTRGRVYAYAALGHGAWEAALVNLVGPGETVLVPETGRFAIAWAEMAEALGIRVVRVPTDMRRPVEPGPIETAIAFASGIEPDRPHERARERHGVAFGEGIGPFRGQLLRIGHRGDLDGAMVPGALGVLECVLREGGVPHGRGRGEAALAALAGR